MSSTHFHVLSVHLLVSSEQHNKPRIYNMEQKNIQGTKPQTSNQAYRAFRNTRKTLLEKMKDVDVDPTESKQAEFMINVVNTETPLLDTYREAVARERLEGDNLLRAAQQKVKAIKNYTQTIDAQKRAMTDAGVQVETNTFSQDAVMQTSPEDFWSSQSVQTNVLEFYSSSAMQSTLAEFSRDGAVQTSPADFSRHGAVQTSSEEFSNSCATQTSSKQMPTTMNEADARPSITQRPRTDTSGEEELSNRFRETSIVRETPLANSGASMLPRSNSSNVMGRSKFGSFGSAIGMLSTFGSKSTPSLSNPLAKTSGSDGRPSSTITNPRFGSTMAGTSSLFASLGNTSTSPWRSSFGASGSSSFAQSSFNSMPRGASTQDADDDEEDDDEPRIDQFDFHSPLGLGGAQDDDTISPRGTMRPRSKGTDSIQSPPIRRKTGHDRHVQPQDDEMVDGGSSRGSRGKEKEKAQPATKRQLVLPKMGRKKRQGVTQVDPCGLPLYAMVRGEPIPIEDIPEASDELVEELRDAANGVYTRGKGGASPRHMNWITAARNNDWCYYAFAIGRTLAPKWVSKRMSACNGCADGTGYPCLIHGELDDVKVICFLPIEDGEEEPDWAEITTWVRQSTKTAGRKSKKVGDQ